jgi:hypothetical protein
VGLPYGPGENRAAACKVGQASRVTGANQLTVWQRWARQPQKVWLRRALFQVHLWSGIAVGLYILLMSSPVGSDKESCPFWGLVVHTKRNPPKACLFVRPEPGGHFAGIFPFVSHTSETLRR